MFSFFFVFWALMTFWFQVFFSLRPLLLLQCIVIGGDVLWITFLFVLWTSIVCFLSVIFIACGAASALMKKNLVACYRQQHLTFLSTEIACCQTTNWWGSQSFVLTRNSISYNVTAHFLFLKFRELQIVNWTKKVFPSKKVENYKTNS